MVPITSKTKFVFVFGSNLAGRHGKGAALFAKEHYGAIYGRGKGLQGDSYAIPTKDINLKPLPLDDIKKSIVEFILFVNKNPNWVFILTPIGTGLAGHSKMDIWAAFQEFKMPPNVLLTSSWMN